MEIPHNINAPSELPPLRVHHFLTWMVVAAPSFALLQVISRRIGYDLHTFPIVSTLPYLFQTLAITALGYTVYWYRQGHRLLEEPGQGLLLPLGIQYLWGMTTMLLVSIYEGKLFTDDHGVAADLIRLLVSWGGLLLLIANVFIWGFLYLRFLKVPGWRTYFIVMAILQIAALVVPRLLRMLKDVSPLLARLNAMLSLVPSWILNVAAVIGLAYLVVRNLRSSQLHHWSHWCGVLCALLVGIRDLNMSIMQMLTQIGWMQ